MLWIFLRGRVILGLPWGFKQILQAPTMNFKTVLHKTAVASLDSNSLFLRMQQAVRATGRHPPHTHTQTKMLRLKNSLLHSLIKA